jgi:NRAMP (natural resistance-associated macrophage protein)-like metal ion transporter
MRFMNWIKRLGPGLITGAADDDPSGIATYSQVGAQFGFAMLWTAWLSYPFMVSAQLISARIGRVTGHGIAFNLRKFYPPWLLYGLVILLLVANVINLAADLGAMGQALQLIIGGPSHLYALAFGALCAALQVFLPYPRYVPFLKWLTLALLAYVVTVFMVDVPWIEVVHRTVIPTITFDRDFLVGLTAVLGTTISPYLFFWQASHEAEEQRATPGELPLKRAPAGAAPTGAVQCRHVRRWS